MGITNFFLNLLFKIITGFFSAVLALTSILAPVGKELPKTPDDFTPVLRFAVCSDVHLNGEEDQVNALRFADFFEDTYAYAETQAYKNVDAFLVAGDMTNGGRDHEYTIFNKIKDAHLREDTEFLTVLGNHEFIEYRDTDSTVAYDKYKEFVNSEVDTHTVINGYHFIGVSYADDAKTFNGKPEWLKEQLDIAKKDTPDKPIFVMQHPHPFATVYGSVNWSDLQIKNVLSKYPQVIDFSGHSHYAANDPRCIWQGSFTAVGTGSLAALIVNVAYVEGDCDAPGESGAYWIVEADADGNVRMRVYDVVDHTFFEKNDYYLSDITKQKSHYYNWNNLKSFDTTPVFPDSAKADAYYNAGGEAIVRFPNAESYWGTETYMIKVTGKGSSFEDTVISNYVRQGDSTMFINAGKLPEGEYNYSITPVSPYAKNGKALTGTFTLTAKLPFLQSH